MDGMSDDWDYEIPVHLPTLETRDKPKLYLPDGREVVVKKPMGFARHPAVPSLERRHD